MGFFYEKTKLGKFDKILNLNLSLTQLFKCYSKRFSNSISMFKLNFHQVEVQLKVNLKILWNDILVRLVEVHLKIQSST